MTLQQNNRPAHIAIIMDGNGRWAKAQSRPRVWGHQKGVERVKEIVKEAINLKIPYLTLYAFSEENWQRPKAEVHFLFTLLERWLENETNNLHEQNVLLKPIGELKKLPEVLQKKIAQTSEKMSKNNGLQLNIAISYGGRSELVEACSSLLKQVKEGLLDIQHVTKDLLEQHLSTAGCPDPDLLIRTSGEKRISNFLLWQIAYTELWFTDTLWPDFSRDHFLQAISDFQARKRRYGAL